MKKELLHTKVVIPRCGGFSLVELLVAVAVFSVFLVAFADVVVSVNRQAKNSLNKERAVALAEESLEAARNLRDQDFGNLVDGSYGLVTTSSRWGFSDTPDVTGIFTRVITISTLSAHQKKIAATVSWADQISEINSVTLSTYVTNWRVVWGSQADNFSVGTSTAYIRQADRKYVRGIILNNTSGATSTIASMAVSWTKANRNLTAINTPYGSTAYGPLATSTGVTVILNPQIILAPNTSGRQLELIFNNPMSGAAFNLAIQFRFTDASSMTVSMSNLPTSTP